MKVRDAYERAILGIELGESLRDAALRMHSHAVGALAVYREHRVVGIITERDLLRAVSEATDLGATPIGEYMTSGVVTVTPEHDLAEAASLMVRVGARHLPVVDESGQMLGMLSARDLMSVVGDVMQERRRTS